VFKARVINLCDCDIATSIIDFTVKESQKEKIVKKDGLEKLATLEERMRGN
jgi:hypothetical protein